MLNTEKINNFLKEKIPNTSLHDKQQLDTRVYELTVTIQEAIDHAVPWTKPSTHGKDFWSQECDTIVRETKHAFHEYLQEGTLVTWENYQAHRNRKVAYIRSESRRCWREHVATTTNDPQGAWKLMRWAKDKDTAPRPLPQTPDLIVTDSSGQKQTVTDLQGKLRAFKESFFPEPRKADLSDIRNSTYPEPVTTEQEIHEQEVYKALHWVNANKAPGPDQIPNSVLKAIKDWLVPRLVTIFNASLRLGYHPRSWKRAITLALRKPRKGNYSFLKAYRPIALLNTMGKLLETVIARRLSQLAETYDLLPRKQMGARPGRSAETALQLITEQVHEIWNLPGPLLVATILSLDISGAFDHVSHERLAHNLRKRRIPLWIVSWVSSFVTDRTTTIKVAEGESELLNVNTGIPQGSPISPILFLFFISDLLSTVDNEALRVSGNGFVDDINILTYGASTERNCKILEEIHRECIKWATTHGAIFAPEKYEVIHLTRARKRFNLKAAPVLDGLRINTKGHIRILGVQVDTKLKWRPHLAHVKEKAASLLLATSRITSSTWGAGLTKAKILYDTVVTPALLYGSSIWYSPQGTSQATKTIDRQLETIQNSQLRKITGAYKAVNRRILEKESDTPPITTRLEILAAKATRRYEQSIGGRIVREEAAKIRARGQAAPTTRQHRPRTTPGQEKTRWLSERIPKDCWNRTQMERRGHNDRLRPLTWKEALRQMAATSWEKRWETYIRQVPIDKRSPAHRDIREPRSQLHATFSKATSALVTQIRTEKIGLNAFLAQQRVPGYTAACQCGWGQQTAKHILVSCPNFADDRTELFRNAGTHDYSQMIATTRGAYAAAQFLQRTGLLPQFQLGLG
jgi:Reverse transcriptase (RNA-dependent DNA polymerase)